MELDEFKSLWLRDEAKLDKIIRLSLSTLGAIQEQKVRSVLKPLYWQRAIELVFHAAAIVLLGLFCWRHGGGGAYSLSAYMLLLLYGLLIIHCWNQLRSLWGIRHGKDVVSIQSALAKIRSSSLAWVRLSILMIPAMLSFPVVVPQGLRDLGWNLFGKFDIVRDTNGHWWASEAVAFIILIPLGTWFYGMVNHNHIQKSWVRKLIEGAAGKSVLKAMVCLKELEDLQQGK
ncbi:MAG TPA: hypothetical protein VNS58_23310 [Puia sp.]|nr:hypothetical protein [Puia sp.]